MTTLACEVKKKSKEVKKQNRLNIEMVSRENGLEPLEELCSSIPAEGSGNLATGRVKGRKDIVYAQTSP